MCDAAVRHHLPDSSTVAFPTTAREAGRVGKRSAERRLRTAGHRAGRLPLTTGRTWAVLASWPCKGYWEGGRLGLPADPQDLLPDLPGICPNSGLPVALNMGPVSASRRHVSQIGLGGRHLCASSESLPRRDT